MSRNLEHYPLQNTSKESDSAFHTFIDIARANEEKFFSSYAAFSKDHKRYRGCENDHRLPYKRDVDRIVHSKAYARYTDKTQVVYLVDNDHITHRGLHVQLVSNFARGIAEILQLNLDLVEAISLGHDVGHTPFGHEGERYLSSIAKKRGVGYFSHSLQSCRLLSHIEPLNLGFAVYDGFLCHDGGMKERTLYPKKNKSWEDHFSEQQQKKEDPNINLQPATLEGCLVKMCDTISYVGKDIEDAIALGIIERKDIPKTILGSSNRDILNYLARDMIKSSYDKGYIEISIEAFDALKDLRTFNFQNIYTHPKLKVESFKIKSSYKILFEYLFEDFQKKEKESYLWNHFLSSKEQSYLDNFSVEEHIIDFLAGMTDRYFVRTLQDLVIPSTIQV